MADLDEQFNETIETLRQRFFRTSLVALVLLYFVLAGLHSAMSRVQSDEVTKLLAPIEGDDVFKLGASWVFSANTRFLPSRPGTTSDEVIAQVGRELDALARKWFSVEFDIVGTKIGVDLRPVAPAIPFLAIVAAGYFIVLYKKIHILEAAWAKTFSGEQAERPWRRQAFHRHPNIMAQWAILLAALVLLGDTVNTMGAMAPLLSMELRVDYLNALAVTTAWTAFYVNHASAMLRADTVRPKTPLGFTRMILTWVQAVTTVAVDYWPRLQLAAGTVLVFATLTLSTGVACVDFGIPGFDNAYEGSQTGYELLTNENSIWFSSTIGATSVLMEWAYAGVLAASVFGLLLLVMRRWSRGRFIQWAVRFTRFFPATMLTLAAGTLWVFCRSEEFREIGNVYGQGVLASAAVWLWHARKKRDVYASRRDILGLVLAPMAVTFGLQAAIFLWNRSLIGVPTLLLGCLMQYRIYSAYIAKQR